MSAQPSLMFFVMSANCRCVAPVNERTSSIDDLISTSACMISCSESCNAKRHGRIHDHRPHWLDYGSRSLVKMLYKVSSAGANQENRIISSRNLTHANTAHVFTAVPSSNSITPVCPTFDVAHSCCSTRTYCASTRRTLCVC